MVQLGADEKRVIEHLQQVGNKNVTEIADGLKMDKGNVSKIVTKLIDAEVLEEKGGFGNEKIVGLCEDVVVKGDEAIVPSGEFAIFDKLRDNLLRFLTGKKEKQQIDSIVELFKGRPPELQNYWGLYNLLITFGIDHRRSQLIAESVFPGQNLPAQMGGPYGTGYYGQPIQPGQPTPYGMPAPPPVYVIQAGGNPQPVVNPPQQPGQPIIVTVPGAGPQQSGRVVETSFQMETIREPILDDEGKPRTDEKGNILFRLVQRPFVIQPQTQSSQFNPLEIVKTMNEGFEKIAKELKPEKGAGKEVDEERLASKVKDAIKPHIDDVSGRVGRIEKELEFEKRLEPYKKELESRRGAGELSDEKFRLRESKEVIEKTVVPAIDRAGDKMLGVMLIERLAILEEKQGVQPGTYISPALASLGVKLSKGEVTEAEKEEALKKLHERI